MKSLVNELLLQTVQQHGLAGKIENECVIIESGELIFEADVFEKNKDAVLIIFEVKAYSPLLNERCIIETFAGLGSDTEQAVHNAFVKFLLGSFHVLIESLTKHQCDSEQVEIEPWLNRKQAWQVYSGSVITQHHEQSLLYQTYDGFEIKLKALFAETDFVVPAWIRLFVAYP